MIFGIAVIGITILYFALFTACIFKGAFRPANYLDKKVKENINAFAFWKKSGFEVFREGSNGEFDLFLMEKFIK